MFRRKLTGSIAVITAILALAACSPSGTTSDNSTALTETDLTAEVPAEYRDGITAAVLSAQPPLSWVDDSGQIQGMFQAMLKALEVKLGVPIELESNSFTNALAGVTAARYDMLPGTTVRAERLEVLDFVSMYRDGYTFATPEGGPEVGDDPMSLCGMTVAGQTSDGSISVLEGWSDECVAAGQAAISVVTYPSYADAQVTVASGRNSLLALPISSFQSIASESDSEWVQTGFTFSSTIDAISFPKGSELTTVIAKAMNELIADGTYNDIILEYMTEDNLITESVINPEPATSEF